MYISSYVEITTESIKLLKSLKVSQFYTMIGEQMEFSFASAMIDLNENVIKEVVDSIAKCVFSIPKNNSNKNEVKQVKLNFNEISAKGTYPDGFIILVTVDKFTANIQPKAFDLYFYNSKIYDLEEKKEHIISTTICKVHKEYKNNIAFIDVLGDEIDIFLPRHYYLARAVVKFLKGSHKIYK